MKSIVTGALSAALLLHTVNLAAADVIATPGKNAAYVSDSSVALTTAGYTSVASVTLNKGKKKRVVEVDVVLEDKNFQASSVSGYATINGLQMEPDLADVPVTPCNTAFINCTLSVQFWADIDALEAANPGVFVGQPLVIDVLGKTTGVNVNGMASVRARLVKK